VQREWRKKQLDKEREYASQIEALERMKLQVEEEMHVKIKGLEKELRFRKAGLIIIENSKSYEKLIHFNTSNK